MANKFKLSTKLIGGFVTVAVVTLIVGSIGYWGIGKISQSAEDIGGNTLPCVKALLLMNNAQLQVDDQENQLYCTTLTKEQENSSFKTFDDARKAEEDARKIFEPLPRGTEEESLWKDYLQAWDKWWKDHETFVVLAREYSIYREPQKNANEQYKKMADQALGNKSFEKAKSILESIWTLETEDHASTTVPTSDYRKLAALGAMLKTMVSVDDGENSLLCRTINLGDRKEIVAGFAEIWKTFDHNLKTYESLPQSDEEKKLWAQFGPALDDWKTAHQNLMKMVESYNGFVEAEQKAAVCYEKMIHQGIVVNGESYAAAEKPRAKIIEINMHDADESTTTANQTSSLAKLISVVGMAIGFVLALAFGIVLALTISKALNRIINGLASGAEQVTSASGQVASASQQLAQGASEQASSLEETSASLEEMASMTNQNADNANQANVVAKQAAELAGTGVESMKKMQDAIDRIKNSASETAKIIKTLDELAFQTTLQALNAAVEAARAGEAGKGIAVVAEEVRNLARRSAEAAKNTADLIEGSQKNADAGVQVTAEVAKNLAAIKENAGKVATLIAEIAAASKEQSQGIGQVTTAVSEMDKVVQQNAANAEESASAAEELSSQAEEVNGMVSDLNTIVTGSTTVATTERRQLKGPARTPLAHIGHKALPAPAHKTQAQAKLRPEAVIPLDDKDLKEF